MNTLNEKPSSEKPSGFNIDFMRICTGHIKQLDDEHSFLLAREDLENVSLFSFRQIHRSDINIRNRKVLDGMLYVGEVELFIKDVPETQKLREYLDNNKITGFFFPGYNLSVIKDLPQKLKKKEELVDGKKESVWVFAKGPSAGEPFHRTMHIAGPF